MASRRALATGGGRNNTALRVFKANTKRTESTVPESTEPRPAAQANVSLSQMMPAPAGAPLEARLDAGRCFHEVREDVRLVEQGPLPRSSSILAPAVGKPASEAAVRPGAYALHAGESAGALGAYHGDPDLTIPSTSEIHREAQDDVITFRPCGTFDSRAAVYLRKELKETHAARVVIDFSGVHQLVEVGVGLVSGALQSGSVELRGLNRRQAAIFRYFDIEVESDRSAAGPVSLVAEPEIHPMGAQDRPIFSPGAWSPARASRRWC